MDPKLLSELGNAIAARAQSDDVIGIGSGRTAEAIICALALRVKDESLTVSVVPTSYRSAEYASSLGLSVLDGATEVALSWAFDGADEVDPQLQLLKGGGGAFLSEKIVARRAGGIVVAVTEEKLVEKLGTRFAVPLEVVPMAVHDVHHAVKRLGGSGETRLSSGKMGPLVTDFGNFIIDARFGDIGAELHGQLKSITGVIETGIFVGLTKEVLVAGEGGVFRLHPGGKREQLEL